jgi:hypothetical protein
MEQERTVEQAAEKTQGETTSPEGGTNAIAVKPKTQLQAVEGGVLPILPRNINEATQYASGLIAANIVPDAFRYNDKEARELGDPTLKGQPNKSLILMGVLKCLEIGVAPQTGLAGLLPLNGRFTVWGDLAASLVQRTGKVKNQTVSWFGSAIDESAPLGDWPKDAGCEVRYWREGQDQPYVGRFTIRDAERANLWMNQYKKPWVMYPKRMLFNRARAFALRDGFSDGLMGLSIAEEVMDAMPAIEAEPRSGDTMAALTADEDNGNEGAENG